MTYERTDLVEASARYNERDALESSTAASVVNFVHSQSQNSRFTVQALDEMGVTGVGRKNLDVEVKMWFLGSYPSVVFDHGRLAMRDVDPWLDTTSSVLRIRANDLETVAVDAPSE